MQQGHLSTEQVRPQERIVLLAQLEADKPHILLLVLRAMTEERGQCWNSAKASHKETATQFIKQSCLQKWL